MLAVMTASAAAAQVASHAPTTPAGAFANNAPPQPRGRPVARVNGAVLTDFDLLHEMYMIFPYARQHNGAFPQAMEADIRQGALKMLEFEELVYQEAQQQKMTIAPARLDQAVTSFREHFPDPEMYQLFMKTECQGQPEVLRAKIRRALLIEDRMKAEVADKSAVSVAEAKAYYDQHPEKFRTPDSYAVQTISAVAPQNAAAAQLNQARQRAEDFLRQARATRNYEEFGMLAEKISEDDYRVMMGDHRLVEAAKLPPQLLATVQKMQPGQVSGIITIEQVFAIVRLIKHVPAGTKGFDEVKDPLRQNLQQQKTERLRAELNGRLRQGAKVEEL
jgi:parvulin-like peptidyl-prolyl isomerase